MATMMFYLSENMEVRPAVTDQEKLVASNQFGAKLWRTKTDNGTVSTVFLVADHGYSAGGGDPVVFETMIFGGPHDEGQWRYKTYEEAMEGHLDRLHLLEGGRRLAIVKVSMDLAASGFRAPDDTVIRDWNRTPQDFLDNTIQFRLEGVRYDVVPEAAVIPTFDIEPLSNQRGMKFCDWMHQNIPKFAEHKPAVVVEQKVAVKRTRRIRLDR